MNIQTMLEPFSDKIVHCHIVCDDIPIPGSISFLTAETTAEPDCIYLSDRCCDEDLLPLLYKMDCGTVFLWSSENWPVNLEWDRIACNCILVRETPAKTYNSLHLILKRYENWKEIFSLLNNNEASIQHICDLAAAAGSCYAAVYDWTGRLICTSDQSVFPASDEKNIVNIFAGDQLNGNACEYAAFSASGKPGLSLRLPSGNYLMAVSENCSDLQSFMDILAPCAEAALQREGFFSRDFETLMRDILGGTLTEENAISRSLLPLFPEIENEEGRIYFSLYVMRPDQGISVRSFSGLCRFFQGEFGCRTLEYKGDIVMLSLFREKDNLRAIKRGRVLSTNNWTPQSLENKLRRGKASLCAAIPTGFFDRIQTVYILCMNTLRLHSELPGEEAGKRLIYCSDYQTWNIIDYCSDRYREIYGNDDLVTLIAPEVVLLRKYDLQHNDYLSDILRIYLNSGKKIDITAQNAFVHRNTVTRKLDKITELTQLDLDDAMVQLRIMLSLQMLEYYESRTDEDVESIKPRLRIQPEE